MNPVFQQNVSISSAQRFSPPSASEAANINGRKTFYMAGEDLSFESVQPETGTAQSFNNDVKSIQSYEFQESITFQAPTATKKPSDSPAVNPQIANLEAEAEKLRNSLSELPQKGIGHLFSGKQRQKLETELVKLETQIKTLESKQNLSEGAGVAIDSIEYYSRVSENDYVNDDNKPMLHAENGMQLMYIGLIGIGQDESRSEAAKAIFSKLAQNPQIELNQSELQLLETLGLKKNESGLLASIGSGEVFKASDATDALGILTYQKELGNINEQFAATAKSKGAVGSVRNLTEMVGKSRQHFVTELNALEQKQAILKNSVALLTEKKEQASLQLQNLNAQMTTLNGSIASVQTWVDKIEGISGGPGLSAIIQSDPGIKGFLNQTGIEVRQDQGQIALFKDGQAVTETEALHSLFAKGQDLLQNLKQERSALEQDINTAKTAVEETQAALSDVENQVESVKQQQQTVIDAQDEYTSGLEELRAIKNDPERWAALSTEEQQAILKELELSQPLLKRSQAVMQSVNKDLAEATELITETRDFIQQAHNFIEQAQQLLTVASILEGQMNVALASFEQYIQQLESGQGQQAEVNQLVDRANELSAKLVLTPGVKTHDISELIQEWQDILKETSEILTRWDKSSSDNAGIERKRMQAYAEKLLDDVAYQMDFMQNLSQQREQSQRDYLQRVVPQLSSNLISAA